MNNFIQHGRTLTLAAPYDVLSGQGALVGSIFGVAVSDTLSGAEGEFNLEGVYELPKFTGITFTVGEKVYWNAAGKKCDETDSSGSWLIGVVVEAAGSSATSVKVRLNGTTVS